MRLALLLGVVLADYFILRRRVLDTNALISGDRPGGPFW